jgi:hypothetical protein
MLAGIGFNTIVSLTAIALWVAAPGRGSAPDPSVPAFAVGSEAPHRAFSSPGAAPPTPPARNGGGSGSAEPVEARADPALPTRRPGRLAPISGSPGNALADRLHLSQQALDLLADARGQLPKASAERLERAFDAGNAFARRLSLDDSRTQSATALFTQYAFNILREEKRSAPGSVDPARIEEIAGEITGDLRLTCGDQAGADAARALSGL